MRAHFSRLRMRPLVAIISLTDGAVAQLGERLPCTEEVRGSSPLSSTKGVSIGRTPICSFDFTHGTVPSNTSRAVLNFLAQTAEQDWEQLTPTTPNVAVRWRKH